MLRVIENSGATSRTAGLTGERTANVRLGVHFHLWVEGSSLDPYSQSSCNRRIQKPGQAAGL